MIKDFTLRLRSCFHSTGKKTFFGHIVVLIKPNISAFTQESHSAQSVFRNNLLDGKVWRMKCKNNGDNFNFRTVRSYRHLWTSVHSQGFTQTQSHISRCMSIHKIRQFGIFCTLWAPKVIFKSLILSLQKRFKANGQGEFDREENKSLTKNLLRFISVVRTTSRNFSDNNSHFKDFSAQQKLDHPFYSTTRAGTKDDSTV